MQKEPTDLRICLITFPLPKIQGGHILVENFLRILEPLANEVFLITGNYPRSAIFSPKIRLNDVRYDSKESSTLIKITQNAVTQLRICLALASIARRIDIVIFFVEGTTLILPMLLAKLLAKKTIFIATGSGKRGAEKQFRTTLWGKGGLIFSHLIAVLEDINRRLSNRIVVETSSLTAWLELGRYQKKVFTQGALFVDTNLFTPKKNIRERGNVVTYVGRLSAEKGIINFARAIPLVASQHSDVEFVIVGTGILLSKVEEELRDFASRVKIAGWIAHEKLPDFLNETKLLVVPSYTEGLPNIVLEAMACNTLVLATSVGGIPDIIIDGETGFLLENNSPECIAIRVIEALNHPNPEQITGNARVLVENKYTYEAALARYRAILKM